MTDDPRFLDALALEREAGFVSLSTHGEGGFPETRMLFNLKHQAAVPGTEGLPAPFAGMERDFSSFIGTNTSSRKTAQLRADGRACLYYADGRSFKGLCVQGTLEEETGPEARKALWREGWERYYPQGPDDPDYAVFRFRAMKARYYHGLSVLEIDCATPERRHG